MSALYASLDFQMSSFDERDSEAVISLAADSLYFGGDYAGLGCEHLVEPAHTLHSRVLARSVDDSSVAHDVVHYDQAARTG
jgi:hypothetical protein